VRRLFISAVAAMAAVLLMAPSAFAIDRVNTSNLREKVTVEGILEHERALQDIAIAHDGNRAATTGGYDASVEYVVERLEDAGYEVTLDPFSFPTWTKNGPATLARVSPDPATWVDDTDFIVAQFSGSGDVTGEVFVAGSTVLPPPGGPGTSLSGCAPSDFTGAAGKIVLIQRGTCPFTQKYDNARDAGAIAVLIFNDGFEGREAPLATTAPQDNTIPAAMISNDAGESIYNLASAGPVTLRFAVSATTTPNEEMNVIADSSRGRKFRTIVAGAHLDSVEEGPGINDNGSGTSALIEIAEQIAELPRNPRNRLRFAFWGAEEAGLVGSTAYVEEQEANGGLDQIEANLNFDMIGSPNFARFVYDGDLSDSTPPPSGAPRGSGQIENLFTRYFDARELEHEPTAFDGRSDYGPFIANGVPAGGLFTGAEGIKTAEQEAKYGGVAGLPFDPCYHQACDTYFNLSHQALDEMSDATAHAVWTLARSRSPITRPQGSQAAMTTAKKARKASSNHKTRGLQFKGPLRVR
jgi:Zn-dependent M28 family amino/carboxypeptidase